MGDLLSHVTVHTFEYATPTPHNAREERASALNGHLAIWRQKNREICFMDGVVYGVHPMSTRDRIIEAANAAYSENGYEKFSLRDVAARVGLTPMAIYKHFEDKDHLLHQVQLKGFEMWSAQLDEAAKVKAPRKRLIEIAGRYLRFAEEHTPYFEMMFLATDHAKNLKHVTPEGAALIESVFRRYVATVAECFPEAHDLRGEAVALWAHGHGLVSLYLAGRLAFLDADFFSFHRARVTEYIDTRRKTLVR